MCLNDANVFLQLFQYEHFIIHTVNIENNKQLLLLSYCSVDWCNGVTNPVHLRGYQQEDCIWQNNRSRTTKTNKNTKVHITRGIVFGDN